MKEQVKNTIMEIQKFNRYKILFFTVLILLAGCSDDDAVDLGEKPVADFSASVTIVEQGTTVSFTDLSTNNPTLWTWQFEAASPTYSNQSNPGALYVVKGKHAVTLTVRNAAGADEIKKTEYIEVTAPPIVDIDKVPLVKLGFETNLDNEGSVGTAATVTAGGTQYDLRTYKGGLAIIFNGSTHLTIPGYTGINGDGARSVALWIKTTFDKTSGLVHWGASGSFSRSSFKYQSNGVFRFEYQGGGHNSNTPVNDGEWHHIAYTYDGSTIKLYVDGVEDFTISGITLKTGVSGETDVNIGSQLGGSIFQGMMDDVRIYDVALTPEEIVTISNIK